MLTFSSSQQFGTFDDRSLSPSSQPVFLNRIPNGIPSYSTPAAAAPVGEFGAGVRPPPANMNRSGRPLLPQGSAQPQSPQPQHVPTGTFSSVPLPQTGPTGASVRPTLHSLMNAQHSHPQPVVSQSRPEPVFHFAAVEAAVNGIAHEPKQASSPPSNSSSPPPPLEASASSSAMGTFSHEAVLETVVDPQPLLVQTPVKLVSPRFAERQKKNEKRKLIILFYSRFLFSGVLPNRGLIW